MAIIDKPSDYFETILYTGNGSSQNIGGLDFQPDWVWIKSRSLTKDHDLYDSVRGADKPLESNTSVAEQDAGGQGLTSFRSDGFAIGNRSTINSNSATQVSWNWLAGGTGSSNTDGSISSTVSANTTSGFSIVSYTGTGSNATVGHGLGATPKFVTIKNRTTSGWSWKTHHVAITPSQRLHLNTNDGATTETTAFNSTAPTSSVFSVGTSVGTNGSSNNYIAYCFAEKKGFSKFGSYTGNGNADGTFVYTGFKPAFVIIKKTDGADNWTINDNKRVGYNVDNNELFANLSNAEDTNDVLDLLSNGFKLRHTAGRHNTSGGTYIYMCFAESPFVTSTGIPTTAR